MGLFCCQTPGLLSFSVFDDHSMMYEGDAKDWEPRCTGMANQLRR